MSQHHDQENGSANASRIRDETEAYIRDVYSVVVPIMLTACTLSLALNLLIVASVRWLRKSPSPTLLFSLSLAVADAYSSFVVGAGLVFNSLLPAVYKVRLGQYHDCYILVLEAVRLAGLLVTVLHLLALAVNHYLGILRPLHYAATVTRRNAGVGIGVMWVAPVAFVLLWFGCAPGQGFQSPLCRDVSFLFFSGFRITISVLFFLPLVLMTIMYVHIFFVIQRHQSGLLQLPSDRQLRKNIKALVTTLLILGTYVVGWMPAVLFYILTCLDCLVPFTHIPIRTRLTVAVLSNCLIVAKSLADPIIYAVRMPDVWAALHQMVRCQRAGRHLDNGHAMCSRTVVSNLTVRTKGRSEERKEGDLCCSKVYVQKEHGADTV